MFAAISSLTTLLLVALLVFVFRRNIATINEVAPDIIDHSLRSVAAAAEFGEDLTLVNISEANVELAKRAKAVEDALAETPAINIRQLHARSRGITA